jgi:hypothetical protein
MKKFHVDKPREIGKKKQRLSKKDKSFLRQMIESVINERKKK